VDGQAVDCVPSHKQPGARRGLQTGCDRQVTPPVPAAPRITRRGINPGSPSVQSASSTARGPGSGPGDKAAKEHQLPVCPEGTIPLRRITLEDLVRNGSLDRYLGGVHVP
jgi:hypothetical protein